MSLGKTKRSASQEDKRRHRQDPKEARVEALDADAILFLHRVHRYARNARGYNIIEL